MAIVNLKDVTVTRVNGKGFGLKVREANERDGKTYKTDFTCWFKEPSGLNVGDVVSLSGLLSAKVGDPWTGDDGQVRHSVELSLNSPRITQPQGESTQGANAAPAPAQSQPAATDWAADASAPF